MAPRVNFKSGGSTRSNLHARFKDDEEERLNGGQQAAQDPGYEEQDTDPIGTSLDLLGLGGGTNYLNAAQNQQTTTLPGLEPGPLLKESLPDEQSGTHTPVPASSSYSNLAARNSTGPSNSYGDLAAGSRPKEPETEKEPEKPKPTREDRRKEEEADRARRDAANAWLEEQETIRRAGMEKEWAREEAQEQADREAEQAARMNAEQEGSAAEAAAYSAARNNAMASQGEAAANAGNASTAKTPEEAARKLADGKYLSFNEAFLAAQDPDLQEAARKAGAPSPARYVQAQQYYTAKEDLEKLRAEYAELLARSNTYAVTRQGDWSEEDQERLIELEGTLIPAYESMVKNFEQDVKYGAEAGSAFLTGLEQAGQYGWQGLNWLAGENSLPWQAANEIATMIGKPFWGEDPLKGKNPITKQTEANERWLEYRRMASQNRTYGNDLGRAIATHADSIGASAPFIVINLMSLPAAGLAATGSAATAGLNYTSALAQSSGLQSFQMMAANGLKTFASNPAAQYSMATTFGPSYDDALKEGASPAEATLYATVNSLYNAMIEVGGADEAAGGMEALPKQITDAMENGKGFKEAAMDYVKSIAGEVGEEELQRIFENGLKQIYTDVPVYSNNDPSAIINIGDMLETAKNTAIETAIMSGAQTAGQYAYQGASNIVNGGPTAINQQEAVRAAAREAGINLSDQQIADIASMLSKGSSINDAVFDVLGIDLSRNAQAALADEVLASARNTHGEMRAETREQEDEARRAAAAESAAGDPSSVAAATPSPQGEGREGAPSLAGTNTAVPDGGGNAGDHVELRRRADTVAEQMHIPLTEAEAEAVTAYVESEGEVNNGLSDEALLVADELRRREAAIRSFFAQNREVTDSGTGTPAAPAAAQESGPSGTPSPAGEPSLAGESRAVPDGGDRAESVISAMTPGAQQNDATAQENAGDTDTGTNPAEERTGESEALNSGMQSGEAGSTGGSTLQEQGSGGTIGTKAQPKLSANAAATDFRTKTGVGRQAETRKTVGGLAESLQAEGRVTEEIWNEAKAAAEKMLDESEDASFAEDGTTYKEMRDYLKKTGLKPSGELRGDSADYDAWRKSLYGRITFRNDGMAIDSAYQELADMFGEGLFPSNITGQRDQVDRILWALEAVRPKQVTAAQTAGENYERALNETTRELLAAAGNVAGMDLSGVAAPGGMQDEGARRFDEAVEATMFAFELEGDPLTWEEAMQLVKDFDGIDEAGLPIVPESDLNFGYSLDEYSVEEFEEDANETEAGGAHPEGVHSEMAAENAEAGAAGNEQSGTEEVRSGDSGPVLREDGQAAGGPAETESLATPTPPGGGESGSAPGLPPGMKRSQTESNSLSGVAGKLGGQQDPLFYIPTSERQTMTEAVNRVAADRVGEMQNLMDKDGWTAADVDTAMTIYGLLQADGVRTGDFSAAQAWARVIRPRGTSTAQALQAFSKWTRSGTGMATALAEHVAEAENLSDEEKSRITSDLYGFGAEFDSLKEGNLDGLRKLIKRMSDYRGTGTFAPKNFVKLLNKESNEDYLREFAQRQLMAIASDATSEASLGERLKTWQVLAQLSRIGTFARNIGGNAVFGAQDVLVQNNIGVVLDSIIGKITGRREVKMDKGWTSSQVRKATAEAMRRSVLEVSGDIDMSGDTSRYGTTAIRTNKASSDKAFERFLSRWEQLLSYSLNTSDATFRGRIESATMEGLQAEVEAGHMTQEEAEQIARERADYRLFQNHGIAYGFSKGFHDVFNLAGIGGQVGTTGRQGGFGLGDIINPYPGVPANLSVKVLEYSPANIAKGIWEVHKLRQAAKNGEVKAGQQAQAVMDIARGMSGIPIIAALAVFFKNGLIKNGDDEDDPDALAQNRAEGRGGVQINLSGILRHIDGGPAEWKDGDEMLNIGWLEPGNAFLAIASLVAAEDEDAGRSAMVKDFFEGAYQSVLEMPVMQNLASLVDTVKYSTAESGLAKAGEGAVSYLSNSVTGMLPAPISQTARALDPYYRDLTGDSAVESALNTFYNAIPGVRERMLPVKTDTFGNPKENHPDIVQRFLNSFILPGAVSELNQTEVSARTEAVYKATGEAAVYPDRSGPRSITIEGEKIGLSAAERRSYHETAGQETERLYSEFMGSSAWANMSDAQRAAIMKGLKEFANDTAKRQYAEEHGMEYSSDWDDEARMADPVSYLAAKTSFKDAEKARDYDAIDDFLEGWYGLPRETRAKLESENTVYEALLGASRKGVSSETYFQVNDAVKAQTDAAGSTKGVEKFRGFVNSGADLKTMDALAESYLGSQAYGMYKAGRSSGLKPDQVLAIWEKADGSAGKAADGSISQQELYNALNKYRDANGRPLTEAQKNAIWNSRGWKKSYSEYKP